jgi:hypothetical protein
VDRVIRSVRRREERFLAIIGETRKLERRREREKGQGKGKGKRKSTHT